MNAKLQVDRARWWALSEQPFYGSLAMKLNDEFTSTVPRSATNGRVIKWNPEYLQDRPDPQVRYILLHETLHNTNGHLWRMSLDALSNEAGDYEIALILAQIPGIEAPPDILYDEQYQNMACEEIRATLEQQQQQKQEPDIGDSWGTPQPSKGGGGQSQSGNGQSQPSKADKPEPEKADDGQSQSGGNGDDDGHDDSHGCTCWEKPVTEPGQSDEAAAKELKEEWETAVIQAAQAAQALGVGDVPGDMQRILDRLRHQGIDWRREMADFVKDAMSLRNDWCRSARRHAWQPVIYPRKMVDSYGTIIFARDTSGSINDRVCSQFSALISDCVSEMGCRGIVIDCDSRIQAEIEITDHETCPLTAKGGGGTDFRPVFNRADELVANGEQIAGIVYLTDLYGPTPASSEIPTLWLCTTDQTAPFGRTVKIEEEY